MAICCFLFAKRHIRNEISIFFISGIPPLCSKEHKDYFPSADASLCEGVCQATFHPFLFNCDQLKEWDSIVVIWCIFLWPPWVKESGYFARRVIYCRKKKLCRIFCHLEYGRWLLYHSLISDTFSNHRVYIFIHTTSQRTSHTLICKLFVMNYFCFQLIW